MVDKKTKKIIELDVKGLGVSQDKQKLLDKINRYFSAKLLMKVLFATISLATALMVISWIVYPNEWNIGKNQVQHCNGYGDPIAVVNYAWLTISVIAFCVLFSKTSSMAAGKFLKFEILCLIVFDVAWVLAGWINDPLTNGYLSVTIGIVYYYVLLKRTIDKEMKVIARENAHFLGRGSSMNTEVSEQAFELAKSTSIEDRGGTNAGTTVKQVRAGGSLHKFQEFLENEDFCSKFKNFLAREYCMENYLFYKAVEEFKKKQLTEEETRNVVKSIYDMFVCPGSTLEVNISSEMRDTLLRLDLEAAIDPQIFDKAELEVMTLMYLGPFIRFRGTPEFKKFAEI
jgi:hypothetical protein